MNAVSAAASDPTFRNVLRKSMWAGLALLAIAALALWVFEFVYSIPRVPGGDSRPPWPPEKNFSAVVFTLAVVALMATVTTNLFIFLKALLGRFNPGIQRIGIVIFSATAIYSTYEAFSPRWSWHWKGYGSRHGTIEWVFEGVFEVCLWSTVALALYAVVVAIANWIVSGFKQ